MSAHETSKTRSMGTKQLKKSRKDCDQAGRERRHEAEKTEEQKEEQAANNEASPHSLDMSCDQVDPVTAKKADLSVCE